MQAATEYYIENVAEKLNISRDELIRESLRFYLQKKIRELELEIFKIEAKYGASIFEEFEEKYETGEIGEKEADQAFRKHDDLEIKKDELEKILEVIK